MEFQISPTLIPKYAVRIKIDVSVVLESKAMIRVSFYEEDSEFTPLDVNVIILEGEEYKKWGNDDKYIINYVFEKLSIHKTMNEEIKSIDEAIIEPLQM